MDTIRPNPPMPAEIANGFYPRFEDGRRLQQADVRVAIVEHDGKISVLKKGAG